MNVVLFELFVIVGQSTSVAQAGTLPVLQATGARIRIPRKWVSQLSTPKDKNVLRGFDRRRIESAKRVRADELKGSSCHV